ncbi:hypothetical protein HanIR_Chr17g0855701 [Helianthus annuus]|nr:hypothetical protein HanIR_Chr17g0855701 [Helianthus annuus]
MLLNLKLILLVLKQKKIKPNHSNGGPGRTRTQGATLAPHQTLVHVKFDQIEGSIQSQIKF